MLIISTLSYIYIFFLFNLVYPLLYLSNFLNQFYIFKNMTPEIYFNECLLDRPLIINVSRTTIARELSYVAGGGGAQR